MAKGHLSTEEFFSKLAELFERSKSQNDGSIELSQKRYYGDTILPEPTETNPFPDLNLSGPLPVIIRASNTKSKDHRAAKVKISTVLEEKELEAFYARCSDVFKSGATQLKPRDRSRKKAKAKKRKGGAVAS